MVAKLVKKVMKVIAPPTPQIQQSTKKVKKIIKVEEQQTTQKIVKTPIANGYKKIPNGWKIVHETVRTKSGPNYTTKVLYTHWYLFQKTLYPNEQVLIWPISDSQIYLLVPENTLNCYELQKKTKQMPEPRKSSSMPSRERWKSMYIKGDFMRIV